jgi:hypothetical protein
MNVNNLICPYCNKPFPILVKPSRWVKIKWNESPDAKCPSCESLLRPKISKLIALFFLPLTIMVMILEVKCIERIPVLQNIAGIIVGGVLAGLTAGVGIRLCYVTGETKRKE